MKTGGSVRAETKQAGETLSEQGAELALPPGSELHQWNWVERSVWNERMLITLKRGVKGGKWFSLIDKVYAKANLMSAWKKVSSKKGAAGVDRQSVAGFARRLDMNLGGLEQLLKADRFEPLPVRRCWIDKPGSKDKRPLGIPTVRDRVVQTALRHVLEPIFEHQFSDNSYGFRPGRGGHDALRVVDALLKEGYTWVVDADLKSYFDTIPHGKLLKLLKEKVSDGRVLSLVEKFLKQKVMEGLAQWTPEEGAPQGAVISPLLSNIYLDPLDRQMEEGAWRMVRYADDFVILCRSEGEAQAALAEVGQWVRQAGLTLHPEKTRIVDAREAGGFDFLGYHFERGMKWPREKSMKKLKTSIKRRTRRANGHSLERVITKVNEVLRGWFGYFKSSHATTFRALDGWVRNRMRGILKKRRGGKGPPRGADYQRWPNALFERLGLYSTANARNRLLSPLR